MIKKVLIFIAIAIIGTLVVLRQVAIRWAQENNMTGHVPGDYRALFKTNYQLLPSVNYHRASNTDISTFLVRDTNFRRDFFNVVVYRLAENIDSFTFDIDNNVSENCDFENDDNYAEIIQNYLYRYLKDPRYLKNKVILSVNSSLSSMITRRSNQYVSYFFRMHELAIFYDKKNDSPEVFLRATKRFEDNVIPLSLALLIKDRKLYLVILSITYEGQLLETDYLDKLLNI